MRKISLFILFVYLSFEASADSSLLGKWVDKTHPNIWLYEFSKNHDFTFITNSVSNKKNTKIVSKGVWETGSWVIYDNKNHTKRNCSLAIYAESNECCFSYKFIANNLILTNEYKSDYDFLSMYSMCENRVLIRLEK